MNPKFDSTISTSTAPLVDSIRAASNNNLNSTMTASSTPIADNALNNSEEIENLTKKKLEYYLPSISSINNEQTMLSAASFNQTNSIIQGIFCLCTVGQYFSCACAKVKQKCGPLCHKMKQNNNCQNK